MKHLEWKTRGQLGAAWDLAEKSLLFGTGKGRHQSLPASLGDGRMVKTSLSLRIDSSRSL